MMIDNFSSKELAIESSFIVKNAQAQAIAAAIYNEILFYEFSTRKIK